MLQIGIAIVILLVGFAGGVWPIVAKGDMRARRWLVCGEAFARGIFLSAAIIHLLPDAEENLIQAFGESHYPYTFALAVVTVWLLWVLRHVALRICQHKTGHVHRHWQPYLLLLILSIHSLIVGIALGVSDTVAGMLVLTVAVLAHKGAEGFALSMNMRCCGLSKRVMWQRIGLFSVMTPLGIVLGHSLELAFFSDGSYLVLAIFNAIAAGTFLYVSMDEALSDEVGKLSAAGTCFFGLGIALMALVALAL